MRRAPVDPRLFGRIAAVHFPIRLTLQQVTETKDKYGGVKNAWANINGMTGIPGQVVPVSQTEIRGQTVVQTETTHQIMLGGYFGSITPKMRVQADDGQLYNIVGIEQDPWRNFTQLRARVSSP